MSEFATERLREPGAGMDGCAYCWDDSEFAFLGEPLCRTHAQAIADGRLLLKWAPSHEELEELRMLLREGTA